MDVQLFGGEEYDRLIKLIKTTAQITTFWPLERDSSGAAVIFRMFHRISCFFMGMLLRCANIFTSDNVAITTIMLIKVIAIVTVTDSSAVNERTYTSIIVMSVAVSADVVHNSDNLDEATECALICTAFYLCVVRLTVYSLHQKDMLCVVETMREDWATSRYEDLLVLREQCLFSFRLAKHFIITVALTITAFVIVTVLEISVGSEERMLPFRGYFFVNHTVSPIFECLFAFNAMSGIIGGSMIASATTFNLTVIMHGAAKFAIARRRLEAIKSDDADADDAMKECIRRHQDAITFADTLERIINVVALGQFVISTGLICFAGFQVTSMMQDKGRLMKYASFLNSAILELFLFSFSGNALIDQSEGVGASAYGSDWCGSSFGQNLQIVMMRSTVPSKITAAKFYSMSLESFATVLSTSFSYFTVLTAVNDE